MRKLSILRVTQTAPGRGLLRAGALMLPCALGPAGIKAQKREGDGATPRGRFALLARVFRADRFPRGPGMAAIRATDGWCDDAASGRYNRAVRLPCAARHETLRRADQCYDAVVVLDHNRRPRVRGKGSAVFFHIAHADLRPTAGCVAIRRDDMRRLLPRLARRCAMEIGGLPKPARMRYQLAR